ncbi:MAG: GGDEF domain-containing protein [Lachnospiraceae bacterium]|nr:GGDEF domain-containing protein [Lachnospiraceae bacterium]
MTIAGYLVDHWGMLILLIGLAIMLATDVHLERRMIRRISVALGMLFLYSITCYVEGWLGNQVEFNMLRPVLCAVNYSLVTFILLNVILIVYPEQSKYLAFPAMMNALLCFISIPTGIVFFFTEENHFMRGYLGYLTYFVDALYLAYLIYNLFGKSKVQKEDYPVLVFFAVTCIICLTMPLFLSEVSDHWFIVTIAINLVLYYLYLLQQFTKRDPLTKLLNRQSYYADAEKYMHEITAFIAMDMDGLKEINDSEGHIAGDVALRTLGDCFWRAAQRKQRVYRIGGDEYVILCLGSKEEEVKALISRMKEEVAKTKYTCSIGYAMKTKGSTIDSLYQEADADLYKEKKLFYERTGKQGHVRGLAMLETGKETGDN